jgi:hypothetical protein
MMKNNILKQISPFNLILTLIFMYSYFQIRHDKLGKNPEIVSLIVQIISPSAPPSQFLET